MTNEKEQHWGLIAFDSSNYWHSVVGGRQGDCRMEMDFELKVNMIENAENAFHNIRNEEVIDMIQWSLNEND